MRSIRSQAFATILISALGLGSIPGCGAGNTGTNAGSAGASTGAPSAATDGNGSQGTSNLPKAGGGTSSGATTQ